MELYIRVKEYGDGQIKHGVTWRKKLEVKNFDLTSRVDHYIVTPEVTMGQTLGLIRVDRY